MRGDKYKLLRLIIEGRIRCKFVRDYARIRDGGGLKEMDVFRVGTAVPSLETRAERQQTPAGNRHYTLATEEFLSNYLITQLTPDWQVRERQLLPLYTTWIIYTHTDIWFLPIPSSANTDCSTFKPLLNYEFSLLLVTLNLIQLLLFY